MKYKAILFDVYGTLFDVHSVAEAAEKYFPTQGAEFSLLWRRKQVEYTHILTLSGRYRNFNAVTRNALSYALVFFHKRKVGSAPGDVIQEKLMDAYMKLSPFSECSEFLRSLREKNYVLGVLSNGTPEMLEQLLGYSQLRSAFDHVLSVDKVMKYKTSPQAYQMGIDALGMKKSEILFVSSNGWDIAGAGWFGYPTFWVNRMRQTPECLDIKPSGVGESLQDIQAII